MSNLWNRSVIAVAALILPTVALADISGTLTLGANSRVSMDSGSAVSSGGDFLWNGTTLAPQGKVIALDATALLGATYSGAAGYAELSQALLSEFALAGSSSPIANVAVNDVIGYETNGGNYGKFLVTALSGGTLTVLYTTYESSGSGGTSGPTITVVQNNYSYLVAGLPNYGIAPGTLFIIKGSGMANTTNAVLQDPSVGLPSTLNGASISVTVGGVTTTPPIYYAIATQIAAVLPSNTPAGTGTITVTYGGATATSSITVLASALGLDTYYGTGVGLGVATDLSYNLISYTSSAKPGETLVLWGSGLGATSDSDSTDTSTPHAVANAPTFYVGGIAVVPIYAGRSEYPGVDQIDITIPASVSTGCGVSVVAVSGSIVSNTVTLPIMPTGGVCSDGLTGVNGSEINTLTGKSTYNTGAAFIVQSTNGGQTTNAAEAAFNNQQTTVSSNISGITSIGSCTILSSAVGSTSTETGLNAGTISVTGPTGTEVLSPFPQVPGSYANEALPAGFIPATGGSYTFTGTGGTQVGAFSVSVSYSSPLMWTNSSTINTITRSSGVTVNWTGGASGTYVAIGGSSSSATANASFNCYAPVSAGTFTVPSYVLLALPAGSGNLSVDNDSTPVPFTASGLDFAFAFAGVNFAINPTYN